MSIQMMLLGVGAVATPTYVDDIFSTYLTTGNATARSVNTGVDMTEGGLIWSKCRTDSHSHFLYDTERGVNKYLRADGNNAEYEESGSLTAFNNNGFSLGTWSGVNQNSADHAHFSFRKAPGFFDVVTYTGTGSKRTVSHNLGCQPGMIAIKRTDAGGDNWDIWHKSLGALNATNFSYLQLNTTNASSGTSRFGIPGTDDPTSTTFTVKDQSGVNASGGTYVAYVFAGGESTNALARSVDFDSSQEDALTTAHSSDFDFGSGDFTVEAWIKPTNASQVDPTPISVWNFPDGRRSWAIFGNTSGAEVAFDGSIRAAVSPDGQFATRTEISGTVNLHQWNHVAFTRSSNTLYFFINGVLQGTASFTGSVYSNTSDGIMIGGMGDSADIRNEFDGSISNVRVVKGTAVYTSSFRPPYEPLTNITNTKLLCCNNSSTTGSTVTPGTITAHNSPTASTDSPFDDPAGFVFGESGSESVISTGSYVGNGNADGPEIFCGNGWEPSWLLIKRSSGTEDWMLFDNMRTSTRTDMHLDDLRPNSSSSEGDGAGGDSNSFLNWTSTGFKLQSNTSHTNDADDTYIFCAVRRSDGYVGKPVELGSSVFTAVYDTANAPMFKSNNHVVDFTLQKNSNFATQYADWNATSRLTSGKLLQPNTTAAETSNTYQVFDYQSGTSSFTGGSGIRFGWLWKRHAGFDVVTVPLLTVSGQKTIRHSMNKIPEMIWQKRRDSSTEPWRVFHKDLNGGTNPNERYLTLNTDAATSYAGSGSAYWGASGTLTTSSFDLNNGNRTGGDYIFMLFASISGISAVGSYTGNGSTGQTITLPNGGFQPRFIIIKNIGTSGRPWLVLDTTRGWASGDDQYLNLNNDSPQNNHNYGQPTSTGFTLTSSSGWSNGSGESYVYYCHA